MTAGSGQSASFADPLDDEVGAVPEIGVPNVADDVARRLQGFGLAEIPLGVEEGAVVALAVDLEHERVPVIGEVHSAEPLLVVADVDLAAEPTLTGSVEHPLQPTLVPALWRSILLVPFADDASEVHDAVAAAPSHHLEDTTERARGADAQGECGVHRPGDAQRVPVAAELEERERRGDHGNAVELGDELWRQAGEVVDVGEGGRHS